MIRKILYNIIVLALLSVLMSTSCHYGISFESKLPPNSTFILYGLRRLDNKMDSLGMASTLQLNDSGSVYGMFKFAGERKEWKIYKEKFDSVKIVLPADSLYWKFAILDMKTIEGNGSKLDVP